MSQPPQGAPIQPNPDAVLQTLALRIAQLEVDKAQMQDLINQLVEQKFEQPEKPDA